MLPDDAPADWNRPFLNLVAHCRTDAAPTDVLDGLKAIERELGRVDRGRWAPRPIDLDLLLYGRETLATDRLRVPHPGIAERAFVLTPLAALEPRLTIPGPRHAHRARASRAPARHHLPLWMGIVNLTPDSFSDGGELAELTRPSEARVAELVAAGAELIDLGAESTRPGATPLTADEEWARLEPALGRLVDRYRGELLRPRLSIDTYHVETARRALALGADIINDVSGLTTPAMLELAATSGADFVAMHNLGVPADKTRTLPADQDPTAAVERWLEERIARMGARGTRSRAHRVRSRHRLRQERAAVVAAVAQRRALSSLRLAPARRALAQVVHASRRGGRSRRSRSVHGRRVAASSARAGVDILRVHNVAAHTAAYRGWAHAS